ncbi:unnamed protein product [Thelazia callipaeda]|uniref:Mab-21 domain-containing protein n=1 Tax=Thelazia callipaeda TaxID=103827 RepID=A0A0N5CY80_THECL|nr:unnamed protein product [Thelazia callipaeda]
MLGQNAAVTTYQISHYFNERVAARKSHVHKAIHMIAKIVQEVLKEVEAQEPRFISTLIENNGRYEGITCAFRCNGIWPRSASHWPRSNIPWPNPSIANEVKSEGFDLFSKETNAVQNQPNKQASSMEGDAWAMSLHHAENTLLQHGSRRKSFSILKCLRDTHLDFPQSPITNYILKTLLLFECEKHYNEFEWEERFIGDRVIGVLLQLVSCLQCRKCPHYFLPQLDLLKGEPTHLLDQSAKITWNLVRQLILNVRALESL